MVRTKILLHFLTLSMIIGASSLFGMNDKTKLIDSSLIKSFNLKKGDKIYYRRDVAQYTGCTVDGFISASGSVSTTDNRIFSPNELSKIAVERDMNGLRCGQKVVSIQTSCCFGKYEIAGILKGFFQNGDALMYIDRGHYTYWARVKEVDAIDNSIDQQSNNNNAL